MKKILFATTALVATAGVAAAEVTLGGFGRFGIFYDEGAAQDTRIEQRFRLTATGVAESDNGLKFEGRIRWQTDENAAGTSNVAQRAAAGFAVTSGAWRLDVGHVSDVLDSGDVLDYYGYGVGLTSFAEQSSGWALPASGFGVSGDDDRIAPTIKIRYDAGALTFSASITDDSETTVDDLDLTTTPGTYGTTATSGEEWQVGVGYNFGNYTVGLVGGSKDTDSTVISGDVGAPLDATNPTFSETTTSSTNDFWALGFGGDSGACAFSIIVGDSDDQDDTSYGFSVKYDVGAATDIRFVFADNGMDADDETVAIGFRHSLGGGVSFRGGVGQNTSGDTVADLGLIFNF